MSYLLQRRHSSFHYSQECGAVGIEIAQAHRHELVVQGSIMRDFHTDIIGSEAVHRQSGFGTFQQHRHRLPDMARIKSTGLFVRKLQQLLAPAVLFFGCHHVVYLQGLRAGTLRIAEDMELRHVQALDKLISLPEILLRLSTVPTITSTPIKESGITSFIFFIFEANKAVS